MFGRHTAKMTSYPKLKSGGESPEQQDLKVRVRVWVRVRVRARVRVWARCLAPTPLEGRQSILRCKPLWPDCHHDYENYPGILENAQAEGKLYRNRLILWKLLDIYGNFGHFYNFNEPFFAKSPSNQTIDSLFVRKITILSTKFKKISSRSLSEIFPDKK